MCLRLNCECPLCGRITDEPDCYCLANGGPEGSKWFALGDIVYPLFESGVFAAGEEFNPGPGVLYSSKQDLIQALMVDQYRSSFVIVEITTTDPPTIRSFELWAKPGAAPP